MTSSPVPNPDATAAVDAAITSRRSLRAFLPTPVPRQTVEDILAVASRAASGTNTQPWKAYVLTGESQAALSRKIVAIFNDPVARAEHREEYDYYPTDWVYPTSTADARSVGTCTACSASRKPTRPACMPSTAATTSSSARRSA